MKAAGAALLLASAGVWRLLRRREGMLPVKLGQALLEDLAVLAYQIRVCRTPLPALLEEVLTGGLGAEWLWGPLLALLRRAEENGTTLPDCWRAAARSLPPPLGKLLAPLGPLLPAGGGELAAAVEETREELARFVREEAARQASQGRIETALCLSGVCLAILVLL